MILNSSSQPQVPRNAALDPIADSPMAIPLAPAHLEARVLTREELDILVLFGNILGNIHRRMALQENLPHGDGASASNGT